MYACTHESKQVCKYGCMFIYIIILCKCCSCGHWFTHMCLNNITKLYSNVKTKATIFICAIDLPTRDTCPNNILKVSKRLHKGYSGYAGSTMWMIRDHQKIIKRHRAITEPVDLVEILHNQSKQWLGNNCSLRALLASRLLKSRTIFLNTKTKTRRCQIKNSIHYRVPPASKNRKLLLGRTLVSYQTLGIPYTIILRRFVAFPEQQRECLERFGAKLLVQIVYPQGTMSWNNRFPLDFLSGSSERWEWSADNTGLHKKKNWTWKTTISWTSLTILFEVWNPCRYPC